MNSSNKQINPSLCANGCGFYGSSDTNNLCSKCFNDLRLDRTQPSKDLDLPKFPVSWGQKAKNIANTSTNSSDASAVVKINRCLCCKKKIGITGFSCRCGGQFCGIHRYPEEHACRFDFKHVGRVALAKENPVCKADKIDQRI